MLKKIGGVVLTYSQWFELVDALCWQVVGVGIRDFPDMVCLERLYQQRKTPKEALAMVVKKAREEFA